MNYSSLEHYSFTQPFASHYNDQSEWQGQKSCKFPKSIRFVPPKDLIKTSMFEVT